MDPFVVLQQLLDTAVDPVLRIKAMFQRTGKSEMWSAGQASDDRAPVTWVQHQMIKPHPGLLTPGARF